MPFSPGDEVHVAAFGKGVVRGARNGGRYLIDVRGRAMVVAERELTPVARAASRRAAAPRTETAAEPLVRTRASAPDSLDLHGMTVDAAIAVVEAFLSDAILAGHAEVRIVHGRSGGRLKAAVHGRLRLAGAIRSFRVDPSNPGQTIVRF